MNDLALTYRVRPATQGTAPHPGLLLLHGLGSTEEDLFALAPQLDPRLTVISARAPQEYSWGGYMWWDIERESPGLGGAGIQRSIGLVTRLIEELAERYTLDSKRMYVGGFSQGAAMAGAVALLHPEMVAGAVMVSGFLPPDTEGQYQTSGAAGHPFFQAHGTQDQVVSINYARMTRDFLAATPVDLTYREYPIGHEVSLPELMELSTWLDGVLTSASESIRR